MATIVIRDLDEQVKSRLRERAAKHGRSMEAEAREILRQSVNLREATGADLFDSIRKKIAPLGGVELELPPREAMREPPDFSDDDSGHKRRL